MTKLRKIYVIVSWVLVAVCMGIIYHLSAQIASESAELSGSFISLILEWIGKEKVINHHLDVPYRVLERAYSYDENGQHQEDNGSENMIIHGDNLEALKALLPK